MLAERRCQPVQVYDEPDLFKDVPGQRRRYFRAPSELRQCREECHETKFGELPQAQLEQIFSFTGGRPGLSTVSRNVSKAAAKSS